MKTDYQKLATDFLTKTGTEFKAEFLKNDFHFTGDKDKRDIYKITLKRGSRVYSFNFGNSINNSEFKIVNKLGQTLRGFNVPDKDREGCIKNGFKFTIYSYLLPFPISESEKILKPVAPNEYDVLACLTKYDPGTFENFCGDFGYDTDSKTAEKTYSAVCDEYKNVQALFTDAEIEELSEIS
jgi:hypothetical protein